MPTTNLLGTHRDRDRSQPRLRSGHRRRPRRDRRCTSSVSPETRRPSRSSSASSARRSRPVVADVTDDDAGRPTHRRAPAAHPRAQRRRDTACGDRSRSRRGRRSAQNWNVDVRHVFEFARAALLAPLDPGSVVISLSSGAARQGSPLSGGYAGAKATIKFISAYAGAESERNALGHPLRRRCCRSSRRPPSWARRSSTPTPSTTDVDRDTFRGRLGQPLTAEQVADAIIDARRSRHADRRLPTCSPPPA